MAERPPLTRAHVLNVVLTYAAVASLWILLSDKAVGGCSAPRPSSPSPAPSRAGSSSSSQRSCFMPCCAVAPTRPWSPRRHRASVAPLPAAQRAHPGADRHGHRPEHRADPGQGGRPSSKPSPISKQAHHRMARQPRAGCPPDHRESALMTPCLGMGWRPHHPMNRRSGRHSCWTSSHCEDSRGPPCLVQPPRPCGTPRGRPMNTPCRMPWPGWKQARCSGWPLPR